MKIVVVFNNYLSLNSFYVDFLITSGTEKFLPKPTSPNLTKRDLVGGDQEIFSVPFLFNA